MPDLDALLPPEIAAKAEAVGVAKASQPRSRTFVLAVLAGAFIALGANFSLVVTAGGGVAPGVGRLLGGVVFSLGLVLVVVAGAELFTGDTLLVIACASRRLRLGALLRTWTIVYVGNLVGALGIVALVLMSDEAAQSNGAIGSRVIEVAEHKAALGVGPAIALGILANVLVCLAVWLSFAARSLTDKVVAVILPVSAFVAAGFEHSVANMFILPLGIGLRDGTGWSPVPVDPGTVAHLTMRDFVVGNLLPVTVGNVIGGGVLVGLVYWFVYLRPSRPSHPRPTDP